MFKSVWCEECRPSLPFVELLLLSILVPYSPITTTALAEDTKVCCNATEVDLFLIGDGDHLLRLRMSFQTSSSTSFETSITSAEQVGKWNLDSAWPGTIPESTWSIELAYAVSDAGGANLNMSATVTIGGSSFTAFLGVDQQFVAQGSGTISIDVPVDEIPVSGTSDISVSVSARTVVRWP